MIRADQVSFRIGDFHLQEVTLEVGRGEYFVLLGPPGSGKSMLLECICGLKRVDSGCLYLDGREVTGLEPRQRSIGYVPQDYALFPHLSVEGNIGFGLRASHIERRQARGRIAEAADVLGIKHLLGRRIAGLSGGERQRVALARALVVRPKVLLLDEPVSTLDEATREAVCAELRHLGREFEVTVIHVSHQLEEAFSVADRAGILFNGVFQQVGSLDELLRRPRTEFVARFMRCQNLFTGEGLGPADGSAAANLRVGDVCFRVPGQHEGEVTFMIRPEYVRLVGGEYFRGRSDNELSVKLVQAVDRGAYVRAELDCSLSTIRRETRAACGHVLPQGSCRVAGHKEAARLRLVAHLSHAAFTELGVAPGAELTAVIPQERIYVLPK